MSQYYVGVDLHKAILQVCVLDARGEVHQERRFAIPDLPTALAAVEWLAPFMAQGRLAVEALGCNRWFVNAAKARGWDVLVADAGKLELRKQGKKTDRRDAYEIARRLFLRDLDRCARTHYPSDAEYGRRQVTRLSHRQIQKRTHTLCEIRALLSAYKITPPCSCLWRRSSMAWLRTQVLPTEDLTFALQTLVDDLEAVQGRLRTIQKRIRLMAEQDQGARRLMGLLPSVGVQTALVLQGELGDVHRFRNARAVASYTGVVPRVTASADKAHHGSMTKRGNSHLRWIVGQWAVRLLSTNAVAQAWALPRYRRSHRNKVRVALSRRLIIGVWWMLKTGEAFSLDRCLSAAA